MTQTAEMTFPCRFPIKVMGRSDEPFEDAVLQILRRHVPDLAEHAITRRNSRQGNYAALSIVIEAQNRAQLDALYTELSACEQVLMAL
jgi:putative lipoic acid-binding regulatory protein